MMIKLRDCLVRLDLISIPIVGEKNYPKKLRHKKKKKKSLGGLDMEI